MKVNNILILNNQPAQSVHTSYKNHILEVWLLILYLFSAQSYRVFMAYLAEQREKAFWEQVHLPIVTFITSNWPSFMQLVPFFLPSP